MPSGPGNTQFEQFLDETVDKWTRVYLTVIDDEDPMGSTASPTLVPNHDYYMKIDIENYSTEVRLSRLQIRVTTKAVTGVQLYTDRTFTVPAGRVHFEWPNVDSGARVTCRVGFRVTKELRDAPIVTYGVYATVVPEGHAWDTVTWKGSRTGPR